MGLPVPEAAVRRAIDAVLDQIAQMTAADVADPDTAWQARQDAVDRAMRERVVVATWQQMLDAFDGVPDRPDPPSATKRAAFAGLIHMLGGGEEALSEDLAALLDLNQHLIPRQIEVQPHNQIHAELNGEGSWAELLGPLLSVHHMRRVAAEASFDHLRRTIQVVSEIAWWQTMVVLFGILDLAGQPLKTGSQLDRFDGAMIRQIQRDPMWYEVSGQRISTNPRSRVRHLVMTGIGLLISGRLPAWEAYRDRLGQLAHLPHLHETEPAVPRDAEPAG